MRNRKSSDIFSFCLSPKASSLVKIYFRSTWIRGKIRARTQITITLIYSHTPHPQNGLASVQISFIFLFTKGDFFVVSSRCPGVQRWWRKADEAEAWSSACSLLVWPSTKWQCVAGYVTAATPEHPSRCSGNLQSKNMTQIFVPRI